MSCTEMRMIIGQFWQNSCAVHYNKISSFILKILMIDGIGMFSVKFPQYPEMT